MFYLASTILIVLSNLSWLILKKDVFTLVLDNHRKCIFPFEQSIPEWKSKSGKVAFQSNFNF